MKKKKTYLRPAMTSVAVETELLLAGSEIINISKEPATGPACSKDRGDMTDGFSLWDDEDE